MANYTQEQIDIIIQQIMDAEDPCSVTNQMVATVLLFLMDAAKEHPNLTASIMGLTDTLNTLLSGNATEAIESFNEVITFLAEVTDEQTLTGLLLNLHNEIAGKASKAGDGRLDPQYAPVVMLDSMGQALDSVGSSAAVLHVAQQGDYIYDSGFIKYYEAYGDGVQTHIVALYPQKKLIYCNKKTGFMYRYTGGDPRWVQVGGRLIVNNLTDGGVDVSLSAEMGKRLAAKTRVIFDDMESLHDSSSELTSEAVGNGLLEYNPSSRKILYFYMANAGDTYATCIEIDPDPHILYGDIENRVYRWNTLISSFEQAGGSSSGGVAGSGVFAEAYDYAVLHENTVFQWILDEEDKDGGTIRKPIWHIRNRVFIDAIGSIIDGTKNGVSIKASESGYVSFNGGGLSTAGALDYIAGEVSYTFLEVAQILKKANSAPESEYNGKSMSGIGSSVSSPATLEIDFGWAVVEPPSGGTQAGKGMAPFTKILKMDIGKWGVSLANVFCHGTFAANVYTSRLKELQIRGKAASLYRFCACGTSAVQQLEVVNAADLTIASNASLQDCFKSEVNNSTLVKIDIRSLDTSGVSNMSNFCAKRQGLQTLIIGNFSTVNVSNHTNFLSYAGASSNKPRTLICTTEDPPVMHSTWNFLTGNFTEIKVPAKSGVIERYKAASGWSDFVGTWGTYEEGEY